MSADPRNQAGFSLVETVAAMGILALAAIPLMDVVSDLTQNTSRLETRMLARTVAENVMARTLTDPDVPDGGMTMGSETQMGREFMWSQTASTATPGELQTFEVSVRAREAGPVMARLISLKAVPGGDIPVGAPEGEESGDGSSGDSGEDAE